MSVKGLLKRTAYFCRNKLVNDYCKEIRNSINAPNFKALNNIKEYAIHNTEFYSGYSIHDNFPVMQKKDYIDNYDLIKSKEIFIKPLHVTHTSGSTGVPFVIEQNYEKRMRTIADLKVFGEMANYPSHERMLQLRAYNGALLNRKIDRRENIFRYDISNLSGASIEELILYIKKIKPRIIFGYTSTLESICDYILSSGKEYCFNCKSILVGAEMLTDEIANKILKVFKCPVYDRYSNMEMGIYAQREYGKTNFIVNNASYFVEVLKLKEDTLAEENEVGRLVFTDLYNHAFPMIRYDTGDLGTYVYNSGVLEIKTVLGRKVDVIYSAEGELLSPHSITNKMWGIKDIKQWQFIQSGMGEYRIKINKSGDLDENELLSRLKNVLGDNAHVQIEYVTDIPVMNSQKRKYIINEMLK